MPIREASLFLYSTSDGQSFGIRNPEIRFRIVGTQTDERMSVLQNPYPDLKIYMQFIYITVMDIYYSYARCDVNRVATVPAPVSVDRVLPTLS